MTQPAVGPFERVIQMACANPRFMTALIGHPDFVDRLVFQGLNLSPTEQLLLKTITEELVMPHRFVMWEHRTWEEIRQFGDQAEQFLEGHVVTPQPSPAPKPENYTQTRGLSARR
jgi:hypothetical protein